MRRHSPVSLLSSTTKKAATVYSRRRFLFAEEKHGEKVTRHWKLLSSRLFTLLQFCNNRASRLKLILEEIEREETYLYSSDRKFAEYYYVLEQILGVLINLFRDIKLQHQQKYVDIKDSVKNGSEEDNVCKFLCLNKLRMELLLESCLWDQRLHALLSSHRQRHYVEE